MNASVKFEIKAKLFYDMTGLMAPGKDDPLCVDLEHRGEVFAEWNSVYGEIIYKVLEAVDEFSRIRSDMVD